jgi:Ribbon-helix-helix protein, copG family
MKPTKLKKTGRPPELEGRVKLTITLDAKTDRIAEKLAGDRHESRSSLIRRLLVSVANGNLSFKNPTHRLASAFN